MSAERLRAAAASIRERAERATSGPWFEFGHTVEGAGTVYYDKHSLSADAEHIASWHPVVALAVADWLDESADHLEVDGSDDLLHDICPTAMEGLECSVLGQALAVADGYLGATA